MAWRSWNAFLANIDDSLIRANVDALVAKTKAGASLWDVGFKASTPSPPAAIPY